MTETKSLFSKNVDEAGYLKAGIMGFPGSGKSFTSALLAIGLVKHLKLEKPVYVFDTENSYGYLSKKFIAEGVGIEIARSRALVDLLDAIKEAEEKASVLVIDSVTHLWLDLQESYRKKNNRTFLTLKDWGPIKAGWNKFPELYLNSKLHIILCGRAGDDMAAQEDETTGKLEVIKYGTKMLAEKSLGYEPSLCLEMERVNIGNPTRGQRNVANRVHVLKDRYDKMDGQSFDNPTFETFLPHINELNIGHHSQLSGTDSQKMFKDGSDSNYWERKKKQEIFTEEIQNELLSAYPGRSSEEIKAKTDILFEVFKTRSWAAIAEMPYEYLETGLTKIRKRLGTIEKTETKNGKKSKEEVVK